MKREDLLSAVDELKESEDIAHAIDSLRDIVKDFCDNYESDINDIRDNLSDLAPHIDKVFEAHQIAEKLSDALY